MSKTFYVYIMTNPRKTVQRLVVQIDIKPGSDPNSINLGNKGNVPVGVFSVVYQGISFDATTIVRSSLVLAGAPDLGIGQTPLDLDVWTWTRMETWTVSSTSLPRA